MRTKEEIYKDMEIWKAKVKTLKFDTKARNDAIDTYYNYVQELIEIVKAEDKK